MIEDGHGERCAAFLAELGLRADVMSAAQADMGKSRPTCLTECGCVAVAMLTLGTLHPALPRLSSSHRLGSLKTYCRLVASVTQADGPENDILWE
jgi:hypothetical protein